MKIFSRIEKERYLPFNLQLEELVMAKIKCRIKKIKLVGYEGNVIDSVSVTCPKCKLSIKSYGRSEESIRYGLARLKEECPLNADNFYVAD